MLRLIVTYGDDGGVIEQNIRGHKPGYCSKPSPMVSWAAGFALYCVIRSSQPTGVTQVSIQASSEWGWTFDWTTRADCVGSMPIASSIPASSTILRRSSFGILINRDGVQIDDAKNTLVIVLNPDPMLRPRPNNFQYAGCRWVGSRRRLRALMR